MQVRLLDEDAAKISNGRGEGLVLCAQKPSGPGAEASRKTTPSAADLENKLVQASEGAHDKIFYVRDGVRHWVTSREWADRRGLRFPEDIVKASAQQLFGLPEGPPV